MYARQCTFESIPSRDEERQWLFTEVEKTWEVPGRVFEGGGVEGLGHTSDVRPRTVVFSTFYGPSVLRDVSVSKLPQVLY